MPHTPLPWSAIIYSGVYDQPLITSATGPICRLMSKDDRIHEANAAFIVQAVNCHDELLAALANLELVSRLSLNQDATFDGLKNCEVLAAARAAIAKAEK